MTARWSLAIAPFAFVCVGCAEEPEVLPPATSFGVVSVASGSESFSAQASFARDVEDRCQTLRRSSECVVSLCDSERGAGSPAEAGQVTIQGHETVLLDAENDWSADGDRALFDAGDDVLLDLSTSADVPGFRVTLVAPSGTSVSQPADSAGEPLELERDRELILAWVPGEYGSMKFHLGAGQTALTCEWPLSDGAGRVLGSLIGELPASDGEGSSVRFWTEQNSAVQVDEWRYVLVLSGEALGAAFSGYRLEP